MSVAGKRPAAKTTSDIQAWLIHQIAGLAGVAPQAIDPREAFDSFGLSSREAVMLSGDLEEWLGRSLSPTLVYEYPTIEKLAEFLANGESARPAQASATDAATARASEAIAVIGLGCRFPGAEGPEAFWRLLSEGIDAITEVPPERWDINAYYDPDPDTPGKMVTRWGGFVEGVDRFDAAFFGMAPREAANLDPQQRLLLEVTWEALEHAGQRAADLSDSPTGVFIGISSNDYATLFHDLAGEQGLNAYIGTGTVFSVAAGRISYLLGLQGPCLAVDTACSSSLVAVHLACQSLRRGESRMALAGGVNLILSPSGTLYFSKLHAMARDGRCKTFASAADGYVRSDGCGVVVLKRLSDALADGDRVLAVIRGSAMNQDGRSNGLTAPNGLAQQAVIRSALADAGVAPDQIQYVETHGTGTELGDPIEVQALAAVLGEGRSLEKPVLLGAVKANIGHTEAAAGVAGLIKLILALQHGEIPPQLHIRQLNPLIPWDQLPVKIPLARTPWPADGPRLAGLSSFGFSGTNAHLILEAAPVSSVAAPLQPRPETASEVVHLLPLSARSPEALREMAARFQSLLESPSAPALPDLAYTAACRRSHHDHRLAVVGQTQAELARKLAAFLKGETTPGLAAGRSLPGRAPKVVFVFPGQGGQWIGMGRELLRREPVFRKVIEACDSALRRHVDWSLLEVLTSDAASNRLIDEIDVIQPALFAMQAGLAALWRSWGVRPSAVVGHSLGEVAAAYVAGALSLDDAACIISLRSRLMRRTAGQGAMAVVGLSPEEAERAVADHAGRLSVAVNNGPRSTVLAGDPAALDDVLSVLTARDVFCRRVKVDVASHSPQMDPLRPELVAGLAGLQPRAGSIPIFSTVTGAVTDGHDLDADYWGRNLRQPVRFWPAVQQLAESSHDLFLELSPHPALVSAIRDGLAELRREGTVLASLRRDEPEQATLLSHLAVLYTLGVPLDWAVLNPTGAVVDLPRYAWQRERFWLETPAGRAHVATRRESGAHPLLGYHLRSATDVGTHFWETELSLTHLPYLGDHRVQGAAVLPAAAYLEMMLSAASQVFPGQTITVEEVAFERGLFLSEDGARRVQLMLAPQPGGASCQILSRDPAEGQVNWTLHATGRVSTTDAATVRADIALIQERCAEMVAVGSYYDLLSAAGLNYGPAFRGVEHLWRGKAEALAALRLPDALSQETGRYHLHPALLDAALQVLAAALPADRVGAGEAWVPVHVARSQVWPRSGTGRLWSHAVCNATSDSDTLSSAVRLLADDGQVVAEISGLRVQRLTPAQPIKLEDWFLRLAWEPAPALEPATLSGSWLIVADATDDLGDRLRTAKDAQRLLAGHGAHCILATPGERYVTAAPDHYEVDWEDPAQFRQLLGEAFGADRPTLRGVLCLAGTNRAIAGVLHLVQALSQTRWAAVPRVFVVTRGAQAVLEGESPDAYAATVWGLGRTLLHEHPELRPVLVDVGGDDEADWAALFAELATESVENQLALRNGQRYVARLVRHAIELPAPPAKRTFQPQTDHNFRLEVTEAGLLENLTLRAAARRAPGPGQVEIEVVAAGLNFLDTLSALGLRPDLPPGPILLGGECAGRVVAVGQGVETVHVGDEVVALAPTSFAAYTTTLAALTAPKPASLTWEQAASVPIVFLTADYALNHLARLERGERVLIHAAAGGVGLAALQLARRVGAEIFATAGSHEKRNYVRSCGAAYALDSRSLAFVDEILALTNGEGVDVVLNSLAGDAIAKGLALLRPCGRFVEIGKRDIYADHRIGLGPFRKNLAYFAFDLARLAAERPEIVGRRLNALLQQLAAGELQPLPLTVFPITQAEAALRHMAQSKHIGKIVLTVPADGVEIEPVSSAFRADGVYLITGGLGGIGLRLASWLAEQGARHLVLAGRSAPSPAAQAVVDQMRSTSTQVHIAALDVAQADQVAALLDEIRRGGLPLRGIFHAAGLLDDGILLQLDLARFRAMMAPKVAGAWNLHTLTRDIPLDHFVLFSSAAALLGSPGQANYAAGNAFMDALAHQRRASGLPALSVNWGPWAEVGLAARPDRAGRLGLRGLDPIQPDRGLEALAQLLRQSSPQVAVLPLHRDQWQRAYPDVARWPLFKRLMQAEPEARPKPEGVRAEVLAAPPGPPRRDRVAAYLQTQLAQVLGMSSARLEETAPLASLGLDSLMAVELKNRVEAELGVHLPIATLLRSPSIGELVDELAAQLASPAEPAPVTPRLPEMEWKVAPDDEAPLTAEGYRKYPLSQGQRALWLQHQIAPASVYNPIYAVRIRSEVDEAAMRHAAQSLVDRHPALRTTFGVLAGEPYQKVYKHAEAAFVHEHAAGWSEAELKARLQREAEHVYDLENGPLLRCLLFTLGPREHVFVLAAHHLIVDLWSLALLITEFGRSYADPAATLPSPARRYSDFVNWQAALLNGADGARLWGYWHDRLAGDPAPLNLPTDRPRPPVQTFRGAWHALQISPTLTQRLKALSERLGATLYMTLLAAFKVLLYRYTDQTDLVVGAPTTGRSRPEFADVVGYFVNSVALRTDLSGDPTFAELLARVRRTVAEALANQDYPLALLVEKLQPQRDPSRPPLFQTMFVFERSHLLEDEGFSSLALGVGGQTLHLAGLPLESLRLDNPATPFDLTVVMAESERGLGASFNYNADLFEPATIERLAAHFETLLDGLTSAPDEPIWSLPLLTEAERRQLLVEWNATETPFDPHYAAEWPAHRLIEAQAARAPEAVAISLGEATLTYGELDRRANQLAALLQARGVRPDTLVGVCLEPSLEMVVAVLGVLKAGGAYLPLEPRYPAERLRFMLQDSGTALVLTQSSLVATLQPLAPDACLVTLDADDGQLATQNDAISAQPPRRSDAAGDPSSTLAYVIYTSGSTGQPKGVLLEQRGLTNLVHVLLDRFRLTPESRVLQFASFSFDASVSEIVATLAAGARLVLAPREKLRSPDELLALLRREAITVVTLPPSLLAVLPPDDLPALETVISAGEACSWDVAEKWARGRRFLNGYGPTETTVAASYYHVQERMLDAPRLARTVPIGRPNPNTQFYVLDAHRQPVPIGVPGELYIGGVGVGRGYLNRPELTAERFLIADWGLQIADPETQSEVGNPKSKLYKTGDLVRYLPDVNVEFLGRIDDQVKVRGYRIELGEIEAALTAQPEVREAAVVVRVDAEGDQRLLAFVVPAAGQNQEGGRSELIAMLRARLRERLPEFMLPATLHLLDTLPLTPNGKVDRQALARLRPLRVKADMVLPQTDLERAIAEIWQQVLGVERVGAHENFFDLGGHSLLLLKVQSELNRRLGRELPVVELFQYPTVAALAQHLKAVGNGAEAVASGQERAEKQKAALQQQRRAAGRRARKASHDSSHRDDRP